MLVAVAVQHIVAALPDQEVLEAGDLLMAEVALQILVVVVAALHIMAVEVLAVQA